MMIKTATLSCLALLGLVQAAAAQPATCLTKLRRRADIGAAAGGKASWCFGSGGRMSCWTTDLASGASTAAASPGEPAEPKITDNTTDVSVCSADGKDCKKVKPTLKGDADRGRSFEVNADGSLLAAIAEAKVELWDVKAGKRLGSLVAGKEGCTRIEFLGDVVSVRNMSCGVEAGPSDWLATTKGKKIALIGGKASGSARHPAHLDGDRWAFVAEDGASAWIQDVKTGKVDKTFALGTADTEAWPAITGDAKHLAVIYGGLKRSGDIALVDVESGKVTQVSGKRCP